MQGVEPGYENKREPTAPATPEWTLQIKHGCELQVGECAVQKPVAILQAHIRPIFGTTYRQIAKTNKLERGPGVPTDYRKSARNMKGSPRPKSTLASLVRAQPPQGTCPDFKGIAGVGPLPGTYATTTQGTLAWTVGECAVQKQVAIPAGTRHKKPAGQNYTTPDRMKCPEY